MTVFTDFQTFTPRPAFLVLSPSLRCWFSSLLSASAPTAWHTHLWGLCHKVYHAVSKTHVNRGVAFPRHARKMENVAKALDVSPGSVSNHLFSWTCDITPTGLFPGLSFGDNTIYVSPSQNYAGTAVFKMGNQQGPVVQHMELCSMLCGSLDGSGAWGRVDTCMCMAESLHCSPETITTL